MSVSIHYFLSFFSDLLPVATGLFFYHELNKDLKIFLTLLGVAFLTDIFSFALAFYNIENLWIFNIFILINYSLLIIVLTFWTGNPVLNRTMKFSIPVFVSIWIIVQIVMGSLNQLNFVVLTLQGIIFSLLSIYILYRLSGRSDVLLSRDYRFWIVVGLFIYYAGNLLLFAFGYLIETRFMYSAWVIHSLLNITANLFYAGGFLCLRSRSNIGGSSL